MFRKILRVPPASRCLLGKYAFPVTRPLISVMPAYPEGYFCLRAALLHRCPLLLSYSSIVNDVYDDLFHSRHVNLLVTAAVRQ